MLSRLTAIWRWRWARVLVVMYVACVLAPGAAFAFGNGVTAYCALAGLHKVAAVAPHADAHHEHTRHAHGGGSHDHAASHATGVDVVQPADAGGKVPAHHSGHKSDQACCMLACLSALPAGMAAISPPDFAAADQVLPLAQTLAALTPAQLYKPPIA